MTPETINAISRNKVINESPWLQSLLYDLDLLPEQVKHGSKQEFYLNCVYLHFLSLKDHGLTPPNKPLDKE